VIAGNLQRWRAKFALVLKTATATGSGLEETVKPALSAARIARLFRARGESSFIVREVARRLDERLDLMRIDPALVIDVGSGEGLDLAVLAGRYPKAQFVGLDLAPARVQQSPSLGDRLKRMFGALPGTLLVEGEAERLPFKSACADLVWSNCVLHWVNDAETVIAEWARVLKPEAALLFSCFGPDTLQQVRTAFAAVDGRPHTVAFADLHDYGDMLASHGFAQPVMDMERLTLTYRSADVFWADVRALGGNPLEDARRGLLGRAAKARLDAALKSQRNSSGQLELSVEIVYGHAWKGVARSRGDGLFVVSMPTPRRTTSP
jgi:malonyl-CoA O-methyltransferase